MLNIHIKKVDKLLTYVFNCDIITIHHIYDDDKSVVTEKFSVKFKERISKILDMCGKKLYWAIMQQLLVLFMYFYKFGNNNLWK